MAALKKPDLALRLIVCGVKPLPTVKPLLSVIVTVAPEGELVTLTGYVFLLTILAQPIVNASIPLNNNVVFFIFTFISVA